MKHPPRRPRATATIEAREATVTRVTSVKADEEERLSRRPAIIATVSASRSLPGILGQGY